MHRLFFIYSVIKSILIYFRRFISFRFIFPIGVVMMMTEHAINVKALHDPSVIISRERRSPLQLSPSPPSTPALLPVAVFRTEHDDQHQVPAAAAGQRTCWFRLCMQRAWL